MELVRLFVPFWHATYQTDLRYDQIHQLVGENIITGFSLHSHKAYYGTLTAAGFSARRVYSRLKQMSLAPRVNGTYTMRDGHMLVTLRVSPHPIWLTMFAIFIAVGLVYWVGVFPDVYRTGDSSLLLRGLVPLALVYGLPWLIFRAQCGSDMRFWEQALHLRAIAS